MRDYNIQTEPFTFLAILEIQKQEEINEHGKMTITGFIEDEKEEEYLRMLKGEVWEKVEAAGRDGETEILFWGIVTDFSVELINNQKKMTLEITTGSCLMDQARHLRSFQNDSITYKQIFQSIIREYENSGMIYNSPLDIAAGELVLQYDETDWDFLKRLAGRNHTCLAAESRSKGTKLFYDMPEGKEFRFDEHKKYTVKKDLGLYRSKKNSGLVELKETDCLTYIVPSREDHRIGDFIMVQGRKFLLYKICSSYQDGEMLHECYLMQESGLEIPEVFLEKAAGCSMDAMVKAVREDKVQAVILEDENKEQETNIWYPYATVYSTPDGTGWYCMPEPGDMVRLTIPGKREKDAFVTSSVHVGTDSADRKDPDFKVFKSRYQKEVRFTPDSIVITNNQGTKIELTDAEGIHIVSAHSVMLEAAEDITVSSDTGSLIVAGTATVNIKQKGTSINLDKGISFTGGELKVQ